MKYRVIVAIFCFVLVGCYNYSKSCSDGVCTIVENGKVSYTGDPEKIKRIKEMEARLVAKQNARERNYQEMPKRGADEVVRIGLIFPETEYAELKPYTNQFYQWMLEAFSDPRFQVIPHSQIRSYLSSVQTKVPVNKGWNQDGPRDKWTFVPNAESYKRLRDMGIAVDVLVYTSMSPKSQSGLVGGRGQGVGVIKAQRIEISGMASSVYQFKRFNASKVGRSSSRIDIAGVDKDGEVKSATIERNKRNIELDKQAVFAYSEAIKNQIKQSIAPELPSIDALANMHSGSN